MSKATGLDYFDRLYAASDDPWAMRTRWYEQRKRALVMATLARERYDSVFEPACGTGDLTLALAARCERLLASDFSSDAVRLARSRLADEKHVVIDRRQVPGEWPEGRFDLIVLSEFAFYLDDAALAGLQEKSVAALTDDGMLLACHWRRPFAERTQDSDLVHDWFDRQPGLTLLSHHLEDDFRLDLWARKPVSVAQREGLS
jgi:SAM-dependent methyltransferase